MVPAGSTIALTSDLPTVTEGWTLEGPTSRADGVIIDGGDTHRIFELDSNGDTRPTYTLRRLTVQRGLSSFGGGILVGYRHNCVFEDIAVLHNVGTNGAGGVATGEEGTCSFDRVRVMDNLGDGFSGGGGIRVGNGASATIRNSTIADNAAPASSGGGILIGGFSPPMGTIVIEQSTISGNTAAGGGGGIIQIGAHSTSTIRASTITGNSLTDPSGAGGGASFNWTLTLESTLIAGNTAVRGPEWNDIALGNNATTSLGGNFIGVNGLFTQDFPTGAPNTNGDIVGTVASPRIPMIGPLAHNGGTMPTHLPLAGSPMLDAGRCPAGFSTDQRGGPRQIDEPGAPNAGGDACDIGAVEGTSVVVSAAPAPEAHIALGLPFPSPARTGAAVRVTLDTPQRVRLAVVDVLGREVAVLVERDAPAGALRVDIPAARLAPGVYTLRLDGAAGTVARRLTVAR
jgi:hypothetical protein